MKKIFAFVSLFVFCSSVYAQMFVSTVPSDKNVIFEEFTGVKCPNCPDGHTVMAQILASNPGRAFVVAYHPFNSSYTTPYTGDPDFRRHYADSLYMTPWCGTSRYMPSAFVARRIWVPNERLTQRTDWQTYGNTIMTEPSPLNVGMATRYDEVSGLLTVVVDVYYTSGATGSYNLMVTLAENNLQSQQSGGTSPYTHKHTFRESFVGQWGDPLCTDPQQGAFFRKEFTFSNVGTNYLMENCELLAFVLDNSNEEVVSGVGCMVNDTTYLTPDITLSVDSLIYTTGNQCVEGLSSWICNKTSESVVLNDVQPASMVPSTLVWYVDPWPFTTFPVTLNPGDSVELRVKVALPLYASPVLYFYDSLKIVSETMDHYLYLAVDQDLYAGIGNSNATVSGGTSMRSYPNPFFDQTSIELNLPNPAKIQLDVISLDGRLLRRLYNGAVSSSKQIFQWDGRLDNGNRAANGLYLYRLTNGLETIYCKGLLKH